MMKEGTGYTASASVQQGPNHTVESTTPRTWPSAERDDLLAPGPRAECRDSLRPPDPPPLHRAAARDLDAFPLTAGRPERALRPTDRFTSLYPVEKRTVWSANVQNRSGQSIDSVHEPSGSSTAANFPFLEEDLNLGLSRLMLQSVLPGDTLTSSACSRKEVEEFQKFIHLHGRTDGWDDDEHSKFVYVFSKHKEEDEKLVARLTRILAARNSHEIMDHLKWYRSYCSKLALKKQALKEWRADKEKEEMKAKPDQGKECDALQTERSKAVERRRREYQKEIVKKWRAEKEKHEAEKRAERELEAGCRRASSSKFLEETRKISRESREIRLEILKEQKEKRMHLEAQVQKLRGRLANKATESYRERDLRDLRAKLIIRATAREDEEDRRAKVFATLKRRVPVNVERNPDRLSRLTMAALCRQHTAQLPNSSMASAPVMSLRNIPHRGIPKWRVALREFSGTSPWCQSLSWLCGGVTGTEFPTEGGRECFKFLSVRERVIETVLCLVISYSQFKWAHARLPNRNAAEYYSLSPKLANWRLFVLLAYALVFGIEIGFKIASHQIIFLLNPCHITTGIQLFLLAVPPRAFVTTVFRVHCNFLSGAFLAILFPVTGSRQFPCEVQIYWIQHVMMLAVPIYLLCLGGPYTLEPFTDVSLSIVTLSFMLVYHFCFLQPVGMVLEVNLNNMLCPAPSDPFYGPHYRKCAMIHQSLYVPIFTRLYYGLWSVLEPFIGPPCVAKSSYKKDFYKEASNGFGCEQVKSKKTMSLSPQVGSFMTENEIVTIIPKVRHAAIYLMSGKIGPFEPSISIQVPLWVAVMMRQRHLCRIACPEWMSVPNFLKIKEEEKSSGYFTKLPGVEMISIANRILDVEGDGLPDADELRSLLRDIEMTRQNKLHFSSEMLVKESGTHAKVDHLSLEEINALRPTIVQSLGLLHRLHDAVVDPDVADDSVLTGSSAS
ncbi:unnamed protein product [Notodromas monacha]|uniref:Uncharacterized protein n=1 Tax=Notodromas monacha TaxID=399045 RepID=A0A7R9G8V1_9CRUS|nr:unnamed protein product [Notodromas monacha]CAG0912483.1 unnamed protein product [Notodromas monacha]